MADPNLALLALIKTLTEKVDNIELKTETLVTELVNPVPIHRNKLKATNVLELPVLPPDLVELELRYKQMHVECRKKAKADLKSHDRGNQNRFFKPVDLEIHKNLMYDDEKGTIHCIVCEIGKKNWESKQFHQPHKFSDHEFTSTHKTAMIVGKARLQFNTESKFSCSHHPVYPFRSACAGASPMLNYVNQVKPLEHKRLTVVTECMKFCMLQNVAMRGGSREDFGNNYDEYYSENRDDDLHVGGLQGLVCLVDQKFSSIKLFEGTTYGHYTSGGTIKKLVIIMLDEIYLSLDGRMCFAKEIDFAFDGNEGFYKNV